MIINNISLVSLVAGIALAGSVFIANPVLGSDTATDPAERVDPLVYVAPEFRQPLAQIVERYQGQSLSFSTELLPTMREGAARMMARQVRLPSPAVETLMIPGSASAPNVRVFVIGADPDRSRPAILHMHGGGYVMGRAEDDVPRLQQLAADNDLVIVTVDYRLAPETPFPGALDDNYAALRWLYDNAAELGVDSSRIAVMGDSAGGGHAAMLALAARDRGEIALKAQLLIYPMLDDRTGSSREMPYWMGYGSWSADANRFGWSALLGVPAGSSEVPEGAVPARVEDLAGLPPTFIGVGSIDLFAEENIEYARRLVRAGVATELVVVPGAFHGFQLMAPEAESSVRFNAAVDAAIQRAFAVPSPTGSDSAKSETGS